MDCRYGECISNNHHLMWPRKNYRSGIAASFRNHPDNIVRICRCRHDEIHATQKPPKKPTDIEMILFIKERPRK